MFKTNSRPQRVSAIADNRVTLQTKYNDGKTTMDAYQRFHKNLKTLGEPGVSRHGVTAP